MNYLLRGEKANEDIRKRGRPLVTKLRNKDSEKGKRRPVSSRTKPNRTSRVRFVYLVYRWEWKSYGQADSAWQKARVEETTSVLKFRSLTPHASSHGARGRQLGAQEQNCQHSCFRSFRET